jgi:hypothetical protein
MKVYGGVDVQIHIFLISALAGDEWSASRPWRITPGERATGTHWIGGWVDQRAGLDNTEIRKFLTLTGLELRPLGRSVRSQTLYRLRYSTDGGGGYEVRRWDGLRYHDICTKFHKDLFGHSKFNAGERGTQNDNMAATFIFSN